ncbi:MAG: hypothetical protein RQ745_06570, partial [Longimicrobiales bacterium]|nr:hypothetical protein [Longimicrobiales bacterium]
MRMVGALRLLRPAASPLLLALLAGGVAAAQEPAQTPEAGEFRAVFAVVPDTVRVGEPFLLGVAIRSEATTRIAFPDTLPTGEWYEQRRPVETARAEGDIWRADYTLVAWRADPGPIPPFEVELTTPDSRRTVTLRPPAPVVATVLPPPGEEELELRPPKPFLDDGWPLWLLALLLALLVGALLLWRARERRRAREMEARTTEATEALSPRERARIELRALAGADGEGTVEEPVFYDRLEEILRCYAEETRDWSPGDPIRLLADGDG